MAKDVEQYLVTGAHGFVGKSVANLLAVAGHNKVLSTSRHGDAICEIERPNHRHLPSIDLLRPSDLHRLATTVDDWADGPFHVINCAGYFPGYQKISDTTLDEAATVINSNFLTVFATANAIAPVMAAKGGGHFIAFSSHAVGQSYPLMAAFTAAKSAVDSLVLSIANEYSQFGIVANALAIATVDAPNENQLRPTAEKSGWIKVEQLAQLVEQLVKSPFHVMNGNIVHLFNYSDTFFHRSFFDRLGTSERRDVQNQ